MFKKLALVSGWLLITPVFVLATGYFVSRENVKSDPENQPPLVVSESTIDNELTGQVIPFEITDIRPYIVFSFLKGTPLESYSNQNFEVSDKYGIDYRLIPAIAMKETGGGRTANTDSFNAWGFENGRTNFTSWESAIETVGKTLKEKYIAKGLTTPDEIMPVYAPPQMLTGGKWAKDINFFFSQMESI